MATPVIMPRQGQSVESCIIGKRVQEARRLRCGLRSAFYLRDR